MYKTRAETAAACSKESTTARVYSKAAIECAERGECQKAWSLADTAKMAAECAMQAHEALWSLAGENMTDEEFTAFEHAELVQTEVRKAIQAAAEAVRKLTAQPALDPELEALCEQTGTSPEGIKALMVYYKVTCEWTEQQAVAHIKRLFADGTIEAMKLLK